MASKTKKTAKTIGIYTAIYIICTLIFISLFHTPLLKEMEVLMYKGIVFLLISGAIAIILMIICTKKWQELFNIKDIILVFTGFCCINMTLFTLLPVTVERSVSVFTLSYMEENDKPYTIEEMESIFNKKYVKEFRAFDKRFKEQIVSGNIEETEEGYIINDRGGLTVKIFRLTSKLFNTDNKLVYPNEKGETIEEEIEG